MTAGASRGRGTTFKPIPRRCPDDARPMAVTMIAGVAPVRRFVDQIGKLPKPVFLLFSLAGNVAVAFRQKCIEPEVPLGCFAVYR